MKKFFVTSVETCECCNGTGKTPNSDWAMYTQFEKELVSRTGKDFPELFEHENEIFQWWEDHGYEVSGWGDLPPEEETCAECEGSGVITEEVDLADAMESLGFIVGLTSETLPCEFQGARGGEK